MSGSREKITLGALCSMEKGTSAIMRTEPGPYPMVVTAAHRKSADSWQMEGPAVCIPLVSSTGHGDAALHRVHYQEGRFALSNLLVALKVKKEKLCDGKYLYHLLMAKKDSLLVPLMRGTSNVALKVDDIAGVEVELPPLAEQRRLVARIEAVASLVAEAQALRKEAVVVAEALSASLLDAILPKDVEERLLKDIIRADSSIAYGVLVPGPDVEGGVPFVRLQDLDIKNPNTQPNKRIAPEIDAQYKRTRLHGGEILLGVVGSIGKLGVAPETWAGANIARAVCRIIPSEEVDRDYLTMVLSGHKAQSFFKEATRTLAQPTLNVSQLSQTPIPVPSLEEQRRIVRELDALQSEVDGLKRLQAETQAELDGLMGAVLGEVFGQGGANYQEPAGEVRLAAEP